MASKIKENFEKLKKRGLLNVRKIEWRITYATGEQETWRTVKKIKDSISKKPIVKIEERKFKIDLKDNAPSKKDFFEKTIKDWHDVTSRFL